MKCKVSIKFLDYTQTHKNGPSIGIGGRIFSKTKFEYDADFWERFNTIIPEEQLTKAIAKLLLTVQEQ